MTEIPWTEVIILGAAILTGGGSITLKKLGFTIIRKDRVCPAPEGPDECPDPNCQSKVVQTAKDVIVIKTDIKETIFPQMNKTAQDVSFIRGKLEGIYGKD